MLKHRYISILVIVLGLVLYSGFTQTSVSQVRFGVRYHAGPVILSFGNYPCYPYSYYPVYYPYYPYRYYYAPYRFHRNYIIGRRSTRHHRVYRHR